MPSRVVKEYAHQIPNLGTTSSGRWGETNLNAIRAVEVELWLRTLPLVILDAVQKSIPGPRYVHLSKCAMGICEPMKLAARIGVVNAERICKIVCEWEVDRRISSIALLTR